MPSTDQDLKKVLYFLCRLLGILFGPVSLPLMPIMKTRYILQVDVDITEFWIPHWEVFLDKINTDPPHPHPFSLLPAYCCITSGNVSLFSVSIILSCVIPRGFASTHTNSGCLLADSKISRDPRLYVAQS